MPPSSANTTDTVALPEAFAAEVKVSTPLELIAGCVLNKLLLSFVTVNVSAWLEGSLGPLLRLLAQPLTVCAPASSFTVTLLPLVKEGSSLTAVTFTVTVAASESTVPSFTLKAKFPCPSPLPLDAEVYFTRFDPSLTVVPVELIAPPEYCVSAPLAGRLVIIKERSSPSASDPAKVIVFVTSSMAETVSAEAVGAVLLAENGRLDDINPVLPSPQPYHT